MRKQEILLSFERLLKIENYSEQTIKNYLSSIKLFLEYVEKHKMEKVTDKEIGDYLYFASSKKKILILIYETSDRFDRIFIY